MTDGRGGPGALPETEKAGAVWVIGVSAPAVVTGIYIEDANTPLPRYRRTLVYTENNRAMAV